MGDVCLPLKYQPTQGLGVYKMEDERHRLADFFLENSDFLKMSEVFCSLNGVSGAREVAATVR